ncbi:MAG: hypothetical protein NTZ48_06200, partial [Candidatus Omnitrophica bacterium]|nr:hypothetical protein [Candidatus Omnitrophota bacterium]
MPFIKGRFSKLSAIFSILFFLSGCGPEIKNLNSKGKTIVCFGDSITQGMGSERGGDYPAYLKEMLGRERLLTPEYRVPPRGRRLIIS